MQIHFLYPHIRENLFVYNLDHLREYLHLFSTVWWCDDDYGLMMLLVAVFVYPSNNCILNNWCIQESSTNAPAMYDTLLVLESWGGTTAKHDKHRLLMMLMMMTRCERYKLLYVSDHDLPLYHFLYLLSLLEALVAIIIIIATIANNI